MFHVDPISEENKNPEFFDEYKEFSLIARYKGDYIEVNCLKIHFIALQSIFWAIHLLHTNKKTIEKGYFDRLEIALIRIETIVKEIIPRLQSKDYFECLKVPLAQMKNVVANIDQQDKNYFESLKVPLIEMKKIVDNIEEQDQTYFHDLQLRLIDMRTIMHNKNPQDNGCLDSIKGLLIQMEEILAIDPMQQRENFIMAYRRALLCWSIGLTEAKMRQDEECFINFQTKIKYFWSEMQKHLLHSDRTHSTTESLPPRKKFEVLNAYEEEMKLIETFYEELDQLGDSDDEETNKQRQRTEDLKRFYTDALQAGAQTWYNYRETQAQEGQANTDENESVKQPLFAY